jgi:hypothetical protein
MIRAKHEHARRTWAATLAAVAVLAGAQPAAAMPRNGASAHLTAAFGVATVGDHDMSSLVITIVRTDLEAHDPVDGLAFRLDLPANVAGMAEGIENKCGGDAGWNSAFTTVVVTGAALSAGVDSCSITASISSGYSGSYTIDNDNAHIDGGDLGAAIVADSLLVTTRAARLTGHFDSDNITVDEQSTLHLQLYQSDLTPAAVTAGVGYLLTLPVGVVVVAAADNDCGGSVSAVAATRVIALTGGTLTAEHSDCDVSVTVTSPAGGMYMLHTSAFTQLANVTVSLNTCSVARVMCAPFLRVEKLDQTVTFAQPNPRAVGPSPLTASADSGLAPTFQSATPSICTVDGRTLTVLDEGVCTISAGQPGNDRYAPATGVDRTIDILPLPPAPPAVAADPGTSSIAVKWEVPDDTSGITGYTVTAVSGGITTSCSTDAGTTMCVLGAVAGRPYTISVVSHGPNGTSRKTIATTTATATAPAVSPTPPTTDLVLTTTDGDISTAKPGQRIVFVGSGFAPFSTVTITIYSAPTVLGTAITSATGAFSQAITVPANLAAGTHTIVAQGVSPDGDPRAMALTITVPATGGTLPLTGPNPLTLLLAGMAALLAGGALLLATPGRKVR